MILAIPRAATIVHVGLVMVCAFGRPRLESLSLVGSDRCLTGLSGEEVCLARILWPKRNYSGRSGREVCVKC